MLTVRNSGGKKRQGRRMISLGMKVIFIFHSLFFEFFFKMVYQTEDFDSRTLKEFLRRSTHTLYKP